MISRIERNWKIREKGPLYEKVGYKEIAYSCISVSQRVCRETMTYRENSKSMPLDLPPESRGGGVLRTRCAFSFKPIT
jgi:hypothetical protein